MLRQNISMVFSIIYVIRLFSRPFNALIFGSLVAMTGCTGAMSGDFITSAVFGPKWIGKPATIAASQWGRPSKVSQLPDGQTQEYWAFLKTHSFQEVVGGTTQLVAPNVIEQQSIIGTTTMRDDCEIWLTVSAQGIITDFKLKAFRSNSCTGYVNLRPPA